MKELSIEEKAKAYDAAIEKLRGLLEGIHEENCEIMEEDITNIFPELKENEDVDFKKVVSDILLVDNDEIREILDSNGILIQDIYAWLEKQDVQKSDKVEQKFKVGDWIIFNGLTLCINEVVKGYYRTISIGGIPCSYDWNIDNIARLWTIQDAKGGDVLVCEDYGYTSYLLLKSFSDKTIELHCWYNGQTNNLHNGTEVITREDARIHPATKEQRDLLFSKMKEAGYDWDAEKKEPKKIETKPAIEMKTPEESLGIDSDTYNKIADECIYGEQKPAWSEEDEKMVKDIIAAIDTLYYHGMVNWLKSLKDRVKPHWKPEDVHIEALRCVINGNNLDVIALKDLLEQLKKL